MPNPQLPMTSPTPPAQPTPPDACAKCGERAEAHPEDGGRYHKFIPTPPDLRAELLAWIEERLKEYPDAEVFQHWDVDPCGPDELKCWACFSRVREAKRGEEQQPLKHETWCGALALPLALKALRGEVEAHDCLTTPCPGELVCEECAQQWPCVTLGRLHAAIIGGSNE